MRKTYIRTFEGKRVLDLPRRDANPVTTRKRLPWDALQRWPQTRALSFPTPKPGFTWIGAIVGTPDSAEQASLGLNLDTLPWVTSKDLTEVIAVMLAESMPADPWLVLCQVPWRPEGVFGNPADQHVEAVVRLNTGSVMYSRQAFPGAYQRVAVLVAVDQGRVWGVQWRDFPVWSLPGGHVDEGEGLVVAGTRELLEEAGIHGTMVGFLGQFHTPRATTWVVQGVFESRDESLIPDPEEIAAVREVALDELYAPDRIFVKRAWQQVIGLKEVWSDAARAAALDARRAKMKLPPLGSKVPAATPEYMIGLPPGAETEEGAEKIYQARLERVWRETPLDQPMFFHEIPGDQATSVARKGLVGEYGVFSAVGEPSKFVTSPVKTVVGFRVPYMELDHVGPDMRYFDHEQLGAHQRLLQEHPTENLRGAYVSYPDDIPKAWIKTIRVERQ